MTSTLVSPERPSSNELRPLLDDLAYLRTVMVNLYFVGPLHAGDRQWVLIDAGMPGSAERIMEAAEARFGHGSRPSAIILTHGHFDHVGSLETLARRWDAPIYAHPMELPYLTGRSSYPPPDPSVGGGLIAALSWTFSRGQSILGDARSRFPMTDRCQASQLGVGSSLPAILPAISFCSGTPIGP
jgi:glyoxylase-like metal-dependent hydrolase (beta-lactamase superfamily II)